MLLCYDMETVMDTELSFWEAATRGEFKKSHCFSLSSWRMTSRPTRTESMTSCRRCDTSAMPATSKLTRLRTGGGTWWQSELVGKGGRRGVIYGLCKKGGHVPQRNPCKLKYQKYQNKIWRYIPIFIYAVRA